MSGRLRDCLGGCLGVLSLLWGSMSVASATSSPPEMDVLARLDGYALKATSKPADAGLDDGIHLVDLRIVDELDLHVRVAVSDEMVLAEPPRLCLVGPLWNPLDAGLSDRCWGEPDLSGAVAARMSTDAAGHVVLQSDSLIELDLTIERGDERCDYPPGEWTLEVAIVPVVDDGPAVRVYLPDVVIPVPILEMSPLAQLSSQETRFCSYAEAIYKRQGEPSVETSAEPFDWCARRPIGARSAPVNPDDDRRSGASCPWPPTSSGRRSAPGARRPGRSACCR